MFNNYKSAYIISIITAVLSCGLIYYGIVFLDLVPTLEAFNEMYRNSEQGAYSELEREVQNTSTGLVVFGSFILISSGLMLTKFKYSMHSLFLSLLGLCVFSFIRFDDQSFTFVFILTIALVTTFLAYHASFCAYRDNFFLSDNVVNKLKALVTAFLIVTAVLAILFYFSFNSTTTNGSSETMVYEVKFDDGTEYKGEMENNIPHGHGEMNFSNGIIYIGTFVKGSLEGKGKLIRPSGEVYEGDIKAGKPEGNGQIELPNGYIYKGAFTRGAPNGIGECFAPEAGKHSCHFEMGKKL